MGSEDGFREGDCPASSSRSTSNAKLGLANALTATASTSSPQAPVGSLPPEQRRKPAAQRAILRSKEPVAEGNAA
jgi:hypothetical protein